MLSFKSNWYYPLPFTLYPLLLIVDLSKPPIPNPSIPEPMGIFINLKKKVFFDILCYYINGDESYYELITSRRQ